MKNSTLHYYTYETRARALASREFSHVHIRVPLYHVYILSFCVHLAYNNILHFIHTRRREKDTREPMAGSDSSIYNIYYVLIRHYYI